MKLLQKICITLSIFLIGCAGSYEYQGAPDPKFEEGSYVFNKVTKEHGIIVKSHYPANRHYGWKYDVIPLHNDGEVKRYPQSHYDPGKIMSETWPESLIEEIENK